MSIINIIFFGLAPSFIWLLFFLRKDSHPESNKMILKIFFFGMLITFPAALIEMGISDFIIELNISPFLISVLYWFIGVAFIEEFIKYLIIREKILNNSEFDEPIDAMIYMIVAALGFAALENILVLLPIVPFQEIISISAIRFIGATFLHALCSGTIGFFLAMSLYKKNRIGLIIIGLAISTFLHGIYNFSIIKVEDNSYFILIPIMVLIGLAYFVSVQFKKLKNIKSTCKVK
ncbi:MAG: PrsW family glutamic-type intramembrane protease [Candidatus Nealsonbacteria bacterium]